MFKMGKDHELLEAARTGNAALVEKLIFPKSKSSSFAASLGIRIGAHINCQDQNGYTPLHHASLNGHCPVVGILLSARASVNASDNKGSCPLHLAAWNGKSEIVEMLLTSGPNFASVNEQNGDRETALHCSAQHGHTDTVKILLDNHADPRIRNVREESALDLASQYGRLEVVRTLLTYHPKLLAHSPELFTPLHLASRNGHKGVVELLLAHGADINKVSANGTALHEAALFGKHDVVTLLLKREAETDLQDSSGRTALELVSQLDTRVSRDIARRIAAAIQEGDDYEPLRSIVTSTPETLKKRPEVAAVEVPRAQSQSFGEADLASKNSSRSSIITPVRHSRSSQMIPESLRSSTGYRLRFRFLRRSSSTRSSRSLPRLASSSFHGSRSFHGFLGHGKKSDAYSTQDLSIRQHHPSIDMFPVGPTQRRTSTSEPSSPQLGASFLSLAHRENTPEPVFSDVNPTPAGNLPSLESPSHHNTSHLATKVNLRSKLATVDKKYRVSQKSAAGTSVLTSQSSVDDDINAVRNKLREIPSPRITSSLSRGPKYTSSPKSAEITPVSPQKDLNPLLVTHTTNLKAKKPVLSTSASIALSPGEIPGVKDACIPSPPDVPVYANSSITPGNLQVLEPVSKPPPLPPKPTHMLKEVKKLRPPPPTKPPPEDDDDDNFDEASPLAEDKVEDIISSKLSPPSPTEPPPGGDGIFDETGSSTEGEKGDIVNFNSRILSPTKLPFQGDIFDDLGSLSEEADEKVANKASERSAESSTVTDFRAHVLTSETTGPNSLLVKSGSVLTGSEFPIVNFPSSTDARNSFGLEKDAFQRDKANLKPASDVKSSEVTVIQYSSAKPKLETFQPNVPDCEQTVAVTPEVSRLRCENIQLEISDLESSMTEGTHKVLTSAHATFEHQVDSTYLSLSGKQESETLLANVSKTVPNLESILMENAHGEVNTPTSLAESQENMAMECTSDASKPEILLGNPNLGLEKCNVFDTSAGVPQGSIFDSAQNTSTVLDTSNMVPDTFPATVSNAGPSITKHTGVAENKIPATIIPSERNVTSLFSSDVESEIILPCPSMPDADEINALNTVRLMPETLPISVVEANANMMNTSDLPTELLDANILEVKAGETKGAYAEKKTRVQIVGSPQMIGEEPLPNKVEPETLQANVSNAEMNKCDSFQSSFLSDAPVLLEVRKSLVKEHNLTSDQGYDSAVSPSDKPHKIKRQADGQSLEIFTCCHQQHTKDDSMNVETKNPKDLSLSDVIFSPSAFSEKCIKVDGDNVNSLKHTHRPDVKSTEQTAEIVPILRFVSEEQLDEDNFFSVSPPTQTERGLRQTKVPHQVYPRIQPFSNPSPDLSKGSEQTVKDLMEFPPIEGSNKQQMPPRVAKISVPDSTRFAEHSSERFRDASYKNDDTLFTDDSPSVALRSQSPPSLPPSLNAAVLQVSLSLQSTKHGESTTIDSISSSTISISPPFSPPSPNTAMLQVSSALQKVMPLQEFSINKYTPSSTKTHDPTTDSGRLLGTKCNNKIFTEQTRQKSFLREDTKGKDHSFSQNIKESANKNSAISKAPTDIQSSTARTAVIELQPLVLLQNQSLKKRIRPVMEAGPATSSKTSHLMEKTSVFLSSGKSVAPLIPSFSNGNDGEDTTLKTLPLAATSSEQKNLYLSETKMDRHCAATKEKRASIDRGNATAKILIAQPCVEYHGSESFNKQLKNVHNAYCKPRLSARLPSNKPMQAETEVQTCVYEMSDGYTQTYPPRAFQRINPLGKSKSAFALPTHDLTAATSSKISAGPEALANSKKIPNVLLGASPMPLTKVKPFSKTAPMSGEKCRQPWPKTFLKPVHSLSCKVTNKKSTSKDSLLTEASNGRAGALSKRDADMCSVNMEGSCALAHPRYLDNPASSVLSLNDWKDSVSDGTEDLNFPKETRKFKGLIRGSSLPYRSRFCGSRDPAYDSDEFEYDYHFDTEAAFEFRKQGIRAVATRQSEDICGGFYPIQTHISDLAHFPLHTDIMEVDSAGAGKFTPHGLLHHKLTTVTPQELECRSRDSSYDNNNNNTEMEFEGHPTARSSTKLASVATVPTIPSPMSDGLPDFRTIVDTVTAVRRKTSPQGSTSGISSSSSSQFSTVGRQDQKPTNANDEWTQIASAMTPVGSNFDRGSVYTQEFEATFWKIMTGTDLPRRVWTWLNGLNLSQYEEVLVGNGFDNVNFLACDILEEQDLIDMNISNVSHQRRMLDSAKNLPKIRPLVSCSHDSKVPSTVQEWLACVALESHADVLRKMGFNTLNQVVKMSDTEIVAMIPLRGHQKRIRASLGRLNPAPPAQSSLTSSSSSKTTNKQKSSPPLPRCSLLDNINFFKDYSQSLTTRSTTTTNSTTLNAYGTSSSNSSALTNYSSLSDQAVPVVIAEEQDSRVRKSTAVKYTGTLSESISQKRKSLKEKKFGYSDKQPPYNTDLSSLERSKADNFGRVFNRTEASEDLELAISHLTGRSTRVTPMRQENEKNLNMSTSESNEIRVPNAGRASYLSSSGELVLRPPNEATEDSVNVGSWCHNPEVLIKSCCNYQAYYLGSMLVNEVKGVQSTVEACAKMKESTDSMKKIPTVTLSISYRGVKFIDSRSKHEIAEHEIQNISFASQDADDLSTLAYITRDARTNKHYCHVFRVTALDVAYEIILTLGQAFEVAYQLILREKAVEGSA